MAHVPAFVEVTVIAAKQLPNKGKGCNAFVTMQLSNGGKKFATETISHDNNPEWNVQCKLPITGLDAHIQLCVLHRNKLGFEEFIGQVCVPLSEVKCIERNPLWLELDGKSTKSPSAAKDRGKLQVEVQFLYEYVAGGRTSESPPRAMSPGESLSNSATSPTNTPPSSRRKLSSSSSKAKKLVKGLAAIAHDRSPRFSQKANSSHHAEQTANETGSFTHGRAASVEDVLQDLQLEGSAEIPTAANHKLGKDDFSIMPPDSSPPNEESTPSDFVEDTPSASNSRRTSLKIRRRLSMPSVTISASRASGTGVADPISEQGESPLRPRASSSSKSAQNSPVTHKRNKSHSGGWISRNWGGGVSDVPDEQLIAQGNYSALSKQTLVRLVGQQQEELREKLEELTNLRTYIDNVLTRVIEVNPDLLLNLSADRSQGNSDSGRGSTSPDREDPDGDDSARKSFHSRARSLSSHSNASLASTTMSASSSQHSLPASGAASGTHQHTASTASTLSRSSSGDGSSIHLSKDGTSSLELSTMSARHRPTIPLSY